MKLKLLSLALVLAFSVPAAASTYSWVFVGYSVCTGGGGTNLARAMTADYCHETSATPTTTASCDDATDAAYLVDDFCSNMKSNGSPYSAPALMYFDGCTWQFTCTLGLIIDEGGGG